MPLSRQDPKIIAFLKWGQQLSKVALETKRELVPVVPFVNRTKIGRSLRQNTLHKLLGQHLALGAMTPSGEQMESDVLLSSENLQLFTRAINNAKEQEQDIFKSSTSKESYMNKISNQTAIDWYKEHKSEREKSKRKGLTAKAPDRKKKSKPAGLIDAEIDWESAKPENRKAKRMHLAKTKLHRLVIDMIDDDRAIHSDMGAEMKLSLVKSIVEEALQSLNIQEILESNRRVHTYIKNLVLEKSAAYRNATNIMLANSRVLGQH